MLFGNACLRREAIFSYCIIAWEVLCTDSLFALKMACSVLFSIRVESKSRSNFGFHEEQKI